MAYAGIEKFETNDVDVVPQLTRLKEAGADALFLVANVGPSAQVVKSLDRMGWERADRLALGPRRRPLQRAGRRRAPRRCTSSRPTASPASCRPRAQAVLAALKAKYPEIKSLADVTPAVGIANAYDAMHLTALAIAKAGSLEGPKIRDGFYAIDTYEGLIKTYKQPFTPANQDALSSSDYLFTRFVEGEILPLTLVAGQTLRV